VDAISKIIIIIIIKKKVLNGLLLSLLLFDQHMSVGIDNGAYKFLENCFGDVAKLAIIHKKN
jgi:hypothetical protein